MSSDTPRLTGPARTGPPSLEDAGPIRARWEGGIALPCHLLLPSEWRDSSGTVSSPRNAQGAIGELRGPSQGRRANQEVAQRSRGALARSGWPWAGPPAWPGLRPRWRPPCGAPGPAVPLAAPPRGGSRRAPCPPTRRSERLRLRACVRAGGGAQAPPDHSRRTPPPLPHPRPPCPPHRARRPGPLTAWPSGLRPTWGWAPSLARSLRAAAAGPPPTSTPLPAGSGCL